MKKFLVTMICKEVWRAKVIIDYDPKPLAKDDEEIDLETIKDQAWATFDKNFKKELEQENFTKVEFIEEKP